VNFQSIGSGPGVGPIQTDASWHGRCARGEEKGTGSLVASAEGDYRVVDDLGTWLQWQGCVAGLGGSSCGDGVVEQLDWAGALAYCESLEWAGCDDWRLPDRNELGSVSDFLAPSPLVYPALETAGLVGMTWSSTTIADVPGSAALVDFYSGVQFASGKANLHDVICVRGGA
jgi:hypothetical protein